MPSRFARRLATVLAVLPLLTVPAATPASAATVRVMEWTVTGTWSCGAGCGSGGLLSGASSDCGQTGAEVGTASPAQLAADYACSATFSGFPGGVCAVDTCTIFCCTFSVQVFDPTAGETVWMWADVAGEIATTRAAGARVLHLHGQHVGTALPSRSFTVDAQLVGYGCGVCSAAVVPFFTMTVTETQLVAP